MITSRMQLNALIRNKAAGDGNKSLRRIADVRSGRRLRAAHVAARTPRCS